MWNAGLVQNGQVGDAVAGRRWRAGRGGGGMVVSGAAGKGCAIFWEHRYLSGRDGGTGRRRGLKIRFDGYLPECAKKARKHYVVLVMGKSHATADSAGKPFAVGSVLTAFRSAGRAVSQPRSIGIKSIWSSVSNKAVTMPSNSGASCVNKGSPANPHRTRLDRKTLRFAKMPGRTTTLRLHAPTVIPATSSMAIAETAGRRPIISGRTVPAVSGDRHMRLSGARVLPHHPATGRFRVVALARCRSRKPAGKLRQASLPRRGSRSCCTSTALEQRPSRRACS